MGLLGTNWDCNAMGDAAKICPRVPLICAQKAILSKLMILIIPSRQIYTAIDNPSLVPSISSVTTSSSLWNYMRTADDVSHAENLQSNKCHAFLTCTNCKTGSKLPDFSGIVATARANQYSSKAPSVFRSFISNSRCTCHRRCQCYGP